MKVPHVIFQTSPRWFAVRKPRGWTMATRASSSHPSIERYMTPILGLQKLFFPVEMDVRTSGIGIACTDRGMHAQFEKFKQLRLIHYTYRVGIDCACGDLLGTEFPDGVQGICDQSHNYQIVVEADHQMSYSRISGILKDRIADSSIDLFRLSFPDPLNPKSENHLVIEHSIPID